MFRYLSDFDPVPHAISGKLPIFLVKITAHFLNINLFTGNNVEIPPFQ